MNWDDPRGRPPPGPTHAPLRGRRVRAPLTRHGGRRRGVCLANSRDLGRSSRFISPPRLLWRRWAWTRGNAKPEVTTRVGGRSTGRDLWLEERKIKSGPSPCLTGDPQLKFERRAEARPFRPLVDLPTILIVAPRISHYY